MIESLNLEPVAEAGARKLLEAFPHIEFTSGRRSVRDQARAMSQNVVSNRRWIEQTYKASEASQALQNFVNANPHVTSAQAFEEAFATILEGFSSEQLTHLSKHLGGRAFDIKPTNKNAAEIKAMARSLAGVSKFLDREGGLVRWHVQF